MRTWLTAIGIVLAVSGGLLLIDTDGDGVVDTVAEYKIDNLRVAIANRPCPEEGQAGYDYLMRKCLWHKSRGDWCGCVTWDAEPLIDEVTDMNLLPDSLFRKMAVCRYKTDGTWKAGVFYSAVDAVAPVDWVCVVIHPRLFWVDTFNNVETEKELALEEKCGFDITADTWGCCPYCLIWPEGCPPCMGLCKYNRNWAGHEGECNDQ